MILLHIAFGEMSRRERQSWKESKDIGKKTERKLLFVKGRGEGERLSGSLAVYNNVC